MHLVVFRSDDSLECNATHAHKQLPYKHLYVLGFPLLAWHPLLPVTISLHMNVSMQDYLSKPQQNLTDMTCSRWANGKHWPRLHFHTIAEQTGIS
jgi:hypothetical protein